MIGESGDDHHKIERYLVDDDIKKKRALPSLTDLYDDMLDVIPEDQKPPKITDEQERQEKIMRRIKI